VKAGKSVGDVILKYWCGTKYVLNNSSLEEVEVKDLGVYYDYFLIIMSLN